MTDDLRFERFARDWLELGPVEAPADVLQAAFLEIDTTSQERDLRVPWRFPAMTRFALVGGAVAVVAIAGLAGLVAMNRGGPPVGATSPTPASPAPSSTGPTQSPLALTSTFTSSLSGYTVGYPDGWTATPATGSWWPGIQTLWGNPALDVLQNGSQRFVAASQPLAPGMTPDQWYVGYCSLGGQVPACAGAPATWTPIPIGPATGYVDIDGAPAPTPSLKAGAPMFDAVAVVDGRGYEFTLDGAVDRSLFEHMLATVTFVQPTASAVLTQTFTSARHGVTVAYPAGWTVTPATRPWPAGGDAPSPPSPVLDTFTSPADPTHTFVMVSQPLAKGTTPQAWLTTYERSAPHFPAECWPSPDKMEHKTVGGQPAWIHGGVVGCGFTEAIVFDAGRVYELTGYAPVGGIPFDRSLFDALLASVRLDPGAADDTPAAPPAS